MLSYLIQGIPNIAILVRAWDSLRQIGIRDPNSWNSKKNQYIILWLNIMLSHMFSLY